MYSIRIKMSSHLIPFLWIYSSKRRWKIVLHFHTGISWKTKRKGFFSAILGIFFWIFLLLFLRLVSTLLFGQSLWIFSVVFPLEYIFVPFWFSLLMMIFFFPITLLFSSLLFWIFSSVEPFEILQREHSQFSLDANWTTDGSIPQWRKRRMVSQHESGYPVIVIPLLVNGNVLMQKAYKTRCWNNFVWILCRMIDEGESQKKQQKEIIRRNRIPSRITSVSGNSFANPTGSPMRYHYFLGKNCVFKNRQNLRFQNKLKTSPVENLAAAKTLLTDPLHISSVAALSGNYPCGTILPKY